MFKNSETYASQENKENIDPNWNDDKRRQSSKLFNKPFSNISNSSKNKPKIGNRYMPHRSKSPILKSYSKEKFSIFSRKQSGNSKKEHKKEISNRLKMLQKANKNLDKLGGIKYSIPNRSRDRLRPKLPSTKHSLSVKHGEPGSILQRLYERRSKLSKSKNNSIGQSQDFKKPPVSPSKDKLENQREENPFPSIANVHQSSSNQKTPKKQIGNLPPKSKKPYLVKDKTPTKEIEVVDKPLNSA